MRSFRAADLVTQIVNRRDPTWNDVMAGDMWLQLLEKVTFADPSNMPQSCIIKIVTKQPGGGGGGGGKGIARLHVRRKVTSMMTV